jgi:uncharacterized protein
MMMGPVRRKKPARQPMLLDVSTIRGRGDRFLRSYEPSAFASDDDSYRVIAPASLAFDVDKDGDRYRVVGTLTSALEVTCSRCLEPFTIPIDVPFDLRYVPQTLNRGEGEREIDEDDLATAYVQDDLIDLGQLMREQFVLALPMKPLCSEACKGLCPQCGVNLNQVTCMCARRWEDPRFSGLRERLDATD